MKKIFLILPFLLLSHFSYAQTRVVEVDCEPDTSGDEIESGDRNSMTNYYSLGWILGEAGAGSEIRSGNSMIWELGTRYNLRISGLLSTGLELDLNQHIFRLKQQAGKTFPDTLINRKENVSRMGLKGGWYFRINFDPHRGNHTGKYIDLGLAANWRIGTEHKTYNDLPDEQERKVTVDHLPYLESLFYLANVRLGFNWLVFFGQYRFSDILKDSYGYDDLPKLVAGVQVNLAN